MKFGVKFYDTKKRIVVDEHFNCLEDALDFYKFKINAGQCAALYNFV